MNEKERLAEIERRKSAGSGEIPKSFPDERVVSMVSFDETLFLFSQNNIFRVRTADEIDPHVTEKGVPWSVNAYLAIGTKHRLISASFGMLEALSQFVLYENEDQEVIRRMLMQFAVSAAEMEFARKVYQAEIDDLMTSEGDELVLVGTAVQLPRVECFEIAFSIFFHAAKRAVGKLIGVLEWAAGFPVKNGTHVDKIANRIKANKKLAAVHNLSKRLDRFIEPIQFLNEIRNAFEHPTHSRSVILKNIVLRPDGRLLTPTWTLIHDTFDLPPNQDFRGHLDLVIETISNLAEEIMLLTAAIKENGIFGWEASVRDEADIDSDYPCRWKIDLIVNRKT